MGRRTRSAERVDTPPRAEGPHREEEFGAIHMLRQLVEQMRPAPWHEYKAPKYSGVGNVEIYIRQF